MGYVAAIGAVVGAAGSVFGSMGASDRAKAERRAAKKAARAQEALYSKWNTRLEDLISEKENRLYNLGDIFERFNSTGAFGDTDAYKDLRRAQEDFSALAAGDFTAFEMQLRKNLKDTLVNTVGAGAPAGSFAQLGADAQMQLRLQGVQTATGLADFFANQAQNLLGMEFGIMDQSFETGYMLDKNRLDAVTQSKQREAATAGAENMATGQVLSGIGQGLMSYGGYRQQQQAIDAGHALRLREIELMGALNSTARVGASALAGPSYTPSYTPPSSYSAPSTNVSFSNWQEPAGNPVTWGYDTLLPPIDSAPVFAQPAPRPQSASSALFTPGMAVAAGLQVPNFR